MGKVNYIKNKEETLQYRKETTSLYRVYMLSNHPAKRLIGGTGLIKGGLVCNMDNLSYDSWISQNVLILDKETRVYRSIIESQASNLVIKESQINGIEVTLDCRYSDGGLISNSHIDITSGNLEYLRGLKITDCYIEGALSVSGLFKLSMRGTKIMGQLFIEGNIDRDTDDPSIDVEITDCNFEGVNSIVRTIMETDKLTFENEKYIGANVLKDSDGNN